MSSQTTVVSSQALIEIELTDLINTQLISFLGRAHSLGGQIGAQSKVLLRLVCMLQPGSSSDPPPLYHLLAAHPIPFLGKVLAANFNCHVDNANNDCHNDSNRWHPRSL